MSRMVMLMQNHAKFQIYASWYSLSNNLCGKCRKRKAW